MAYAIKTEIRDLKAKAFTFTAQKTMYGGKRIATGDTVFVFASENEGGKGLIARAVVTSAGVSSKAGSATRGFHGMAAARTSDQTRSSAASI